MGKQKENKQNTTNLFLTNIYTTNKILTYQRQHTHPPPSLLPVSEARSAQAGAHLSFAGNTDPKNKCHYLILSNLHFLPHSALEYSEIGGIPPKDRKGNHVVPFLTPSIPRGFHLASNPEPSQPVVHIQVIPGNKDNQIACYQGGVRSLGERSMVSSPPHTHTHPRGVHQQGTL